MRVVHVTDNFAPAAGGLERYVANLAAWQAEQGHDVTVLTLARADSLTEDVLAEAPTVRVLRVPSLQGSLRRSYAAADHQFLPPFPDPVFAAAARRVLRGIRPDVVHAHSWAVRSIVAVLDRRTALVQTLHEYGTVCAVQTYTREPTGCPDGPGLRRCLDCATQRYGAPKAAATVLGLRASQPLLRRVDRFLAISRFVAATCGPRLGGRPVDLVPTFVPAGLERRAHAAARPEWLPSRPYVAYAGALAPHKGIDVLLEAWRGLPDRPALVLCGVRRHDTPPLLDDGIVLRESVPFDDVLATWAEAAVGAVPSVWPEPFGQVAVEGMAAGTPMVLSRTGGLRDIGRDGAALFVPPGDVAALRDGLARVLADPDLAARLAAAGSARAPEYGLDRIGPDVMQSYANARQQRTQEVA